MVWQSSSPFALVLIDGDNTYVSLLLIQPMALALLIAHQFNDEYIKAGAEGGHRAASDLKNRLEAHLEETAGYQAHWTMVVRVYIRLNGLTATYVRNQIVSDQRTVRDFFRGFNEVHPLFEIVDAGDDKEGADTKIKG